MLDLILCLCFAYTIQFMFMEASSHCERLNLLHAFPSAGFDLKAKKEKKTIKNILLFHVKIITNITTVFILLLAQKQ